MLDERDVEHAELATLFIPWGVWLAIAFVLLLGVAWIVKENQSGCAVKHCPEGMQPRLIDHDCLCVHRAR